MSHAREILDMIDYSSPEEFHDVCASLTGDPIYCRRLAQEAPLSPQPM